MASPISTKLKPDTTQGNIRLHDSLWITRVFFGLFTAKLPAPSEAEPSPSAQTPSSSSKRPELPSPIPIPARGSGRPKPGVAEPGDADPEQGAGFTAGTDGTGAFSEYPKKATAATGGPGKKMKISLKKR